MPEKIRVAAYCRVSTLLDTQDTSFETQCAVYRRQIAQNPVYELVGIYGDHGKSGRSMDARPELRRLLSDCEQGKVDLILTKSISRFARNMKECVQTIQRLNELGVNIYFEREGINANDTRCELLLHILSSIAQEESDSISMNLKWAHDRRCAMGKPISGRKPYGFYPKGEWVIDPQQAQRIRLMFDMAERGCSYAQIQERLNQMELAQQTSHRWDHVKIARALRTLAYKGDLLTNTTIAAGRGLGRRRNRGEYDQYYLEEHHAFIVPPQQFDRVQQLLKKRNK